MQEYTIIPTHIKDKHLSIETLGLYTWLSLQADENGVVYTSYADITKRTGLSTRKARTALSALSATKLVTKRLAMLATKQATMITLCNTTGYKGASLVSDKANDKPSDNASDNPSHQKPSKALFTAKNGQKEDVPPIPPLEEKEKIKEKDPLSWVQKEKRISAKDIVEFYNQTIKSQGARVVRCVKLSERRKQLINARLKEYQPEQIFEAITKAVNSRFCNGDNNRGWVADIEFVFSASKMPRLIEGFYDDTRQAALSTQLTDNSPDKYLNQQGW